MSWQASSFLVLALGLAAGFAWYERDKPPARVLALVAALAALAVVGRLAFAAIPNVKPTTDIVLFAGYALGAVPGFVVGAVTAIVSNIFLSQGPWTVWQMAGWGAMGVGGALLARTLRGREPNRFVLAGVCGLAGLVFGAWMDVYQWTLGARQDLDSYLVVAGSSLPYNVAHAVGNVVFCLLIGPLFIRSLRRYRSRLEVSWPSTPATASAAVALLALSLAFPLVAGAATPGERAERYLLRAQNADGGFGAAPDQASSPLYSGWAGLGLAAVGRNPLDVARGRGRSLGGYVKRSLPGLRDIGEIERTGLVLRAAGLDPRSYGGRDLLAEIRRKRRPNGSIAGFVSYTAFGVLALRAAGESAGSATVRWLLGTQNGDGGFGVAPELGERQRHDGGRAPGPGRDRPRAQRGCAARGGLPARRPGGRRRLRARGRTKLQRAVHGLRGAGSRCRRCGARLRRPGLGLPRAPAAPRRQRRVFVVELPDPGVGDGAGAGRAAARGVAGRGGATGAAAGAGAGRSGTGGGGEHSGRAKGSKEGEAGGGGFARGRGGLRVRGGRFRRGGGQARDRPR